MNDEQRYVSWKHRFYEIDGVTKSWWDWCREYNVTRKVVSMRMRLDGRSFEEALKFKRKKQASQWEKEVTINGVTKTMREWAKENGLKMTTVDARIVRGMSVEDAVTKPVHYKKTFKDTPVTINDVTKTVDEWTEEKGLKPHSVRGYYYATGDLVKACMAHDEKIAYNREIKIQAMVDDKNRIGLCLNCTKAYCDGNIYKCIREAKVNA